MKKLIVYKKLVAIIAGGIEIEVPGEIPIVHSVPDNIKLEDVKVTGKGKTLKVTFNK